ncbi:hypothetical protein UlMin_039559 [Ulmus minor]
MFSLKVLVVFLRILVQKLIYFTMNLQGQPLMKIGVLRFNKPKIFLNRAHGIEHLVIPTRDYLFTPSFVDISRAVEFIHKNACCGRTTYVHCKAGRGRSTTILLCYFVEYKNMTPAAALDYVLSQRPRVLLAPSQWKSGEIMD